MKKTQNFTEGSIFAPLVRFALPVLLALLLQTMYGAVDLLVVGQFGTSADVSAVSTGSQVMQTVTVVITGLAMGLTVLVGRKIGEGYREKAGKIIGSGIWLFAILAVVVSAVMVVASEFLAQIMHAPEEAFEQTVSYIIICSSGAVFIVAYNLVGSIFRGIGDSQMPLLTVAVACVLNIAGDLLAGLFAREADVIATAAEYLKAYAIDCLLTFFLFCFIGYFNGCGNTVFVMIQGIVGAFGVRIPVSWLMSRQAVVELFHIGMATPISTLVQILLCGGYFFLLLRRPQREERLVEARK